MAEATSCIFRQIPPWTVVADILTLLKLGTTFPMTFTKSLISLERSEDIAYILSEYYIPCKAKMYLEYTDEKRWITIIKHLLAPHGWVVLSQETTRNKKKAIFYTIERCAEVDKNLRAPIKIDFS
jgi:hypothetical protein